MAKEKVWARVEWGPHYLKTRRVENKSGVVYPYYVKAEKTGLSPLVARVPEEKKTKKEILAWAELQYSVWRSQESKPKEVKEIEKAVEKSQVRFTKIAAKILELTEPMSDEYYRKVEYHIKRLNQFFSVECEFISDWTDNKWKEYVAFRRKLNPNCQLNHDKRQLSRILQYALSEGLIQKVPKLKSVDSEAEGGRCLSDAEISALFKVASQDLRDQMELGLRMAFRQIDIRFLTKDRVDLVKGEITFLRGARSDEGGQKNKKPVVIQINPICLEMLKRRAKATSGKFFFPSPSDPNKPMTSNKTSWYGACKRAQVEAGFHCLRHTCATLMARAGRPEAFTQKYCRMSAKVIRGIYTHLESEDSALLANTIVRNWDDEKSPGSSAS